MGAAASVDVANDDRPAENVQGDGEGVRRRRWLTVHRVPSERGDGGEGAVMPLHADVLQLNVPVASSRKSWKFVLRSVSVQAEARSPAITCADAEDLVRRILPPVPEGHVRIVRLAEGDDVPRIMWTIAQEELMRASVEMECGARIFPRLRAVLRQAAAAGGLEKLSTTRARLAAFLRGETDDLEEREEDGFARIASHRALSGDVLRPGGVMHVLCNICDTPLTAQLFLRHFSHIEVVSPPA